MARDIYIGVDGGATKCHVRIEDELGQVLGEKTTGPANIRISVSQAWESIHAAIEQILHPLNISFTGKDFRFHAGMGLAGCEIVDAYHAFLKSTHEFDTLVVASDSLTACLGAHMGKDGAIIVAGTGVVGFQTQDSKTSKVSGWGFPHDDEGSGAWLGVEAIRTTLQTVDCRRPMSGLAKTVLDYFENDVTRLVGWANQANSTAFAELAPLVISQSQKGDTVAMHLLVQAAYAIDSIGKALEKMQSDCSVVLPCSLIGGIAEHIEPLLSESLRSRLRPSQGTPELGAILLVRKYVRETQ